MLAPCPAAKEDASPSRSIRARDCGRVPGEQCRMSDSRERLVRERGELPVARVRAPQQVDVVRGENLVEREAARLDEDLVVRQQQRAVDVEQDEAAHTASSASRSVRTYELRAGGPC